MHSWYTSPASRQKTSFFRKVYTISTMKTTLDDMYRTEQYLENDPECREVSWTAVLAPTLTDGPNTGLLLNK